MTGERNRSSEQAGALMGKESVARMENFSLFRAYRGALSKHFRYGDSPTCAQPGDERGPPGCGVGGRILIERRAKKKMSYDQIE